MESNSMADEILKMLKPILETEIKREIDNRVQPAISTAKALGTNEKMAYRATEAAELLSISEKFLKELTYAGKIESVKVGSARLYPRDSIIAFLKKNATAELPEYIRRA